MGKNYIIHHKKQPTHDTCMNEVFFITFMSLYPIYKNRNKLNMRNDDFIFKPFNSKKDKTYLKLVMVIHKRS